MTKGEVAVVDAHDEGADDTESFRILRLGLFVRPPLECSFDLHVDYLSIQGFGYILNLLAPGGMAR